MSTIIDIRIHTGDTYGTATDLFIKLIDAASAWLEPESSERWQDLNVYDTVPYKIVETVAGPFDAMVLKKRVELVPTHSQYKITTGIGFPCWRFNSGCPESGFLRLGIDCWGQEHSIVTKGSEWVEGVARLVISKVNPFMAILDGDNSPKCEDINRRVEENIEAFLQLLFQVAKALKPEKIKVFTDSGDLLPFNAHVAFYDTHQSLIHDLKCLAECWKDGIPKYGIPSFESYTKRHDWVFNELRSPLARKSIWMHFSEYLKNASLVDEKVISSILRSNDFDVYRLDEGFVVLNYPYCFNGFLDRFFIALLKVCRTEF